MGEFMCSNSCIASLTSTFVKVRVETATGSQIFADYLTPPNWQIIDEN